MSITIIINCPACPKVPSVAPVEGVAVGLRVITQPAGAEDGSPFDTQPIVEIIDALGNRVTSSTVEVSVAKATGAGILSGDTAVNAVAGVATFTDLELDAVGDHSLTFSSSGLASVTSELFEVAPPPQLLTPVFFSNWSAALGSDNNARGDGGKWPLIGDSGVGLSVLASGGANPAFPSANFLRVLLTHQNEGTQRLYKESGLGVIADVATRNIRFYYRHMELHGSPAYEDVDQHPIESLQSGGFAWIFNTVSVSDTEWYPYLQTVTGDFWQRRWRSPNLTIGSLYRMEIQLESLSSTTFCYHLSIYNGLTEANIYTDSNITNRDGDGSHPVGSVSLATRPVLTWGNKASLAGMRFGCNGKGPLNAPDWPDDFHFADEGCLAVVDGLAVGEVIGAYGSVTGET